MLPERAAVRGNLQLVRMRFTVVDQILEILDAKLFRSLGRHGNSGTGSPGYSSNHIETFNNIKVAVANRVIDQRGRISEPDGVPVVFGTHYFAEGFVLTGGIRYDDIDAKLTVKLLRQGTAVVIYGRSGFGCHKGNRILRVTALLLLCGRGCGRIRLGALGRLGCCGSCSGLCCTAGTGGKSESHQGCKCKRYHFFHSRSSFLLKKYANYQIFVSGSSSAVPAFLAFTSFTF